MPLTIKPKESCRWDLVSLGEVMLRFDPGDRRPAVCRYRPGSTASVYRVQRLTVSAGSWQTI
jgi:2-dehydro-3-deoxygluconokinase